MRNSIRARLGIPISWVFHGTKHPRRRFGPGRICHRLGAHFQGSARPYPQRFPGTTAPHLLGQDGSTPSLSLAASRLIVAVAVTTPSPPTRSADPILLHRPVVFPDGPPPSPVQEPPPPSVRICFHSSVSLGGCNFHTVVPSISTATVSTSTSTLQLGVFRYARFFLPHLPFPSYSPLCSRVLNIDLAVDDFLPSSLLLGILIHQFEQDGYEYLAW
jgi:hypothetical protein